MEEEAPSRRSVAELAGRFKASAPPHDAAGHETEKPVRRRPPRTLQLPKTGEDQEPPGVTSPVTAKAKRNSALIEKLQANLALSPSALLPSPKSPGFRLVPPTLAPPSSGSAPVTTVTTSSTVTPTSPVTTPVLTEEERPASFEAPPTAVEGSILPSINKGRARHSIRRRPPSRRHRMSSNGDEVSEGGDVSVSSQSELEDKTTGGGEEEGREVFKQEQETEEVKEDKTEASTHPQEPESHKEDESKISAETKEEDETKNEEGEDGSREGEEDGGSSSAKEKGEEEDAQEKNSGEKQPEDSTVGETDTDNKEEEKIEEMTSHS